MIEVFRDSLEEFEEVVFIPSSHLASAFDSEFYAGSLFKQMERYMSQNDKVFRCITRIYAALVFAKRHIQNPMQGILDTPMTPTRFTEFLR